MISRGLISFIVIILAGASNTAYAWDGDWTDAASGDNARLFYDEKSSLGKAGTTPPQKYLKPIERDYKDIDPNALTDYFEHNSKIYTPYALARISSPIQYDGKFKPLPVGYYLIKLGYWGDGSINKTRYKSTSQNRRLNSQEHQYAIETSNKKNNSALPSFPDVFIVLANGQVKGVYPINIVKPYKLPASKKLPQGVKIPKNKPLAWLNFDDDKQRPSLYYYFKKMVYISYFQLSF
ncbi:MAG: hypothetical protein AAGI66_03330 [Cyanobacteria bacterium P01_H01_bin.74]